MVEIDYTFDKHISFNKEYYEDVLVMVKSYAAPHGLEFEVIASFNGFLESRFLTDDYPVSRMDYMSEGQDALYEWDI